MSSNLRFCSAASSGENKTRDSSTSRQVLPAFPLNPPPSDHRSHEDVEHHRRAERTEDRVERRLIDLVVDIKPPDEKSRLRDRRPEQHSLRQRHQRAKNQNQQRRETSHRDREKRRRIEESPDRSAECGVAPSGEYVLPPSVDQLPQRRV